MFTLDEILGMLKTETIDGGEQYPLPTRTSPAEGYSDRDVGYDLRLVRNPDGTLDWKD